ncbi:hypothetical protein Q7A53_15840 [Halobacillus rhizosphaerae]|uniref:hypothetical protein n=1 Tax=Halobacillus rhizosphaerae TaxID=3064889 RepID=UPI00398BB7ED
MYIHNKFPHVFDFLAKCVQEDSPEVKDTIKSKVDEVYARGTKIIYQDIDYSKFREDLDIERAIEILNWTMFGFGDKVIQQISSFENMREFGEQYLKEWEYYAEILKLSFYK